MCDNDKGPGNRYNMIEMWVWIHLPKDGVYGIEIASLEYFVWLKVKVTEMTESN